MSGLSLSEPLRAATTQSVFFTPGDSWPIDTQVLVLALVVTNTPTGALLAIVVGADGRLAQVGIGTLRVDSAWLAQHLLT